jgi:hypothetical protein
MAVASRQGLIDYCLRELGHPVVEINVDDDQVEDRIDEAFSYYRDFHYDAVERLYFKHRVTASRLNLTSSIAAQFSLGETVTGASSGAKGSVCLEIPGDVSSVGTSLLIKGIVGTFQTSEIIVGANSQVSSTISSIVLGSTDLKYIQLDDSIVGVVRVMPFTGINTGQAYMWDIRYQLRLNDLFDLLSTSMIYYQQVKQQLSLIDQLLVGSKGFRFQRHMNRVFLDMSWETDADPGEYIVLEVYKILDPNVYTDVYTDRFLKRYATALIKRQWGTNLKKFEGIQMPGGVTLNGQKIYDEAVEEIKELENEMQTTYTEPPNFMVG